MAIEEAKNKIDPELLTGIYGRRIMNFNSDHTKQLVTLIAQLLGIAEVDGTLTLGRQPGESVNNHEQK